MRRSKEAVKAASLAAAYELLTEAGSAASVSTKCRAVRASPRPRSTGTGRSRSALLFDAVMQFAPRLQTPNTGQLSERPDRVGAGLGSTPAEPAVVVRDALDH